MNQPVLSIDVSKSTSYAAAFYSFGKPYKKPMSVRNTPEGIGQLLEWLEDLRNKTDHHPQVVLKLQAITRNQLNTFSKMLDTMSLN